MSLRAIYEELVRLVGRRVCSVEDWHASRWRVVRDAETGRLELAPRRDLTEDARPR